MMRLVAENLTCRRSERTLFEHVSFAVDQGQALTVAGPNGAGKSSLLRILAGFLSAGSGSFRLDGIEGDRDIRHCLHYLGHRDGLRAALTVRENLSFAAASLGAGLDVPQALRAVDLPFAADLPVGLLSAGQRRRIALARLLVARRPLWLLDEPTTALDSSAQRRVAELLQDHLAAGGLAVVASHLPLGIAGAVLSLGAAA